MPRQKTHAEYVAEVAQKHEVRIEVIGTYINSYTNIEHRCTVCGYSYSPRPANILRIGTGCRGCSLIRRKDDAGTIRFTRLTKAEKLEARSLRNQGLTYKQIAKRLGRNSASIHMCLNPASAETTRIRSAQWAAKNPERKRTNHSRYRSFNHAVVKNRTNRARRRKLERGERRVFDNELGWIALMTPPLSTEDKCKIEEVYIECERISKETGVLHHVDHIKPLS